MKRILIGALLAAGGFLIWEWLPSSEELAASNARHREAVAQMEEKERADYASSYLPEGCEIRALPAYAGVEKIVMVRCEAANATTANLQWEEARTENCGKAICTVHETKAAITATIQAPQK